MARYRASVTSPASVEDTFAFLADFRTVSEWDPSIVSSELTSDGEAIRLGAVFHVATKFAGRTVELDYTTVELDAPNKVVLRGVNGSTVSIDTMTFHPRATGGCDVTYDAKLELSGAAKLIDPLMQLAFNPIGAKAKRGLQDRLNRLS